eukprot:3110310-Alexandrium_andersonii.AAC.1
MNRLGWAKEQIEARKRLVEAGELGAGATSLMTQSQMKRSTATTGTFSWLARMGVLTWSWRSTKTL